MLDCYKEGIQLIGVGGMIELKIPQKLLKDSLFFHEKTCNALFIPAFQKNIIIRTAQLFEKVGRVLYPALGGVHVIEASPKKI